MKNGERLEKVLMHEATYTAYLQGIETGEQKSEKKFAKRLEREKEKSYKEGFEAGKRTALDAMKKAGHSHNPQPNIYASHRFEVREGFTKTAPEVCGNCVHWSNDGYQNKGRCEISGCICRAEYECNI